MKLLTYEPLGEALLEHEQDEIIRECFNEMNEIMKSYRVKFLHGYKPRNVITLSMKGDMQVVCVKNRKMKD